MKYKKVFLILIPFLLLNLSVVGQQADSSVPVFAYHRFGDDRYPSTNVEMDIFRQQLQYLKDNDYTVLSLGEALEALDSKVLPDKAVVLTVDDGYESFYTNAFPVLKEFGYPVTIFINTDLVGGKSFMSWQQLKDIHEAGMEIGNHSHSHPHFVNAANPRLTFKEDVSKAQELFEKHLGFQPDLFSYPYGEYTQEIAAKARDMGFKAATAQRSGVLGISTNRYAIPRFPMGGPFATMRGFRSKIKMKPLDVKMIKPAGTLDYQSEIISFSIETPIHESTIQCFVDGTKQKVESRGDGFVVKMPSSADRRILITITAQGKNSGSWHWYSYLLINKEMDEE